MPDFSQHSKSTKISHQRPEDGAIVMQTIIYSVSESVTSVRYSQLYGFVTNNFKFNCTYKCIDCISILPSSPFLEDSPLGGGGEIKCKGKANFCSVFLNYDTTLLDRAV